MLDLDKWENLTRARLAAQLHNDTIRHRYAVAEGFMDARRALGCDTLPSGLTMRDYWQQPGIAQAIGAKFNAVRREAKMIRAHLAGWGMVEVLPLLADEYPCTFEGGE